MNIQIEISITDYMKSVCNNENWAHHFNSVETHNIVGNQANHIQRKHNKKLIPAHVITLMKKLQGHHANREGFLIIKTHHLKFVINL